MEEQETTKVKEQSGSVWDQYYDEDLEMDFYQDDLPLVPFCDI